MEEKIKNIIENAERELKEVKKEADLLNLKSKYLGKSSELMGLLSELKNMSIEDKKKYGKLLNETKVNLELTFSNKFDEVSNAFDIMFDTDDIIDFNSYEKGIEILKKYNVEI